MCAGKKEARQGAQTEEDVLVPLHYLSYHYNTIVIVLRMNDRRKKRPEVARNTRCFIAEIFCSLGEV